MTTTIILWSRALGQVLSWPLVVVVAIVTEITRQVVQTARGVWSGAAGVLKEPERGTAAAERQKREREAEAAKIRREKRTKDAEEVLKSRRQIGAIMEEG